MASNVKSILEDRKFTDPMYAETAEAVKSKVKEVIGRKSAIPKDGVKRKGRNEADLLFNSEREVVLNKVIREVYPNACSELRSLSLSDFMGTDGKTPISKADATVLVNDTYGKVQLYQDVRKFVLFILNETYSTDAGFDLADLSLNDGADLKLAKRRIDNAARETTIPLQGRDIAKKTKPEDKEAAEDNLGYVKAHPKNVIAAIMNADSSKLDPRNCSGWKKNIGDPSIISLDADKRSAWCFRLWLLELYKIACDDTSKSFNLMDYVTDFPNKRLNLLWKNDKDEFVKIQNSKVDIEGKFIK